MTNIKKIYPAIFTVIVSTILLFVFFGNILTSPNYTFFSGDGDGLKSTFGSYYHLQYDKDYWKTYSMNYPYGESVLFTGGQPLIINILKWLSGFGFDFSKQLTGILNVWMLMSIVWAAFFLFLLLRDLNLPWYYALIVANIIVFLSPQLDRFGGHYNLAYVYFLPLYLYLLKRFFDRPSYKLSFVIALVSLLALGTHAYFFALYIFGIFFLLLYGFLYKKKRFGKIIPLILHLLIQIVLPFILFNLMTLSYPSDRSVFPWGFFAMRSFPEAVFLPNGKPYASFLNFPHLKWEGIAFVGMVSTIVTILLIYIYIKKSIKQDSEKIILIDNSFLKAILLGAVVALFISFAYPFKWFMEDLLKYTGPFKQFRAIGRFSWLFYYVINIIAFYLVWNFYKDKKNFWSKTILILAVLWGSYDAYLNVRTKSNTLSNRIVSLEDTQDSLPVNRWIKEINTDNYQAILTVPYFHVGSEVYWIGQSSEAIKNSFIVSWKTGLPLISVMLSRTSISQTLKSLAFYFEPLSAYQIIKEFPNKKDLLLLKQKNAILNENERRFISYAVSVNDNENYMVYSLPLDSIEKLYSDYQKNIARQCLDTNLFSDGLFLLADSCEKYIFESFGNTIPDLNRSETIKTMSALKPGIIYETPLFNDTSVLKISFWMKDLNKDLIPRSMIHVKIKGKSGVFDTKYAVSIFKIVKYVDSQGWGLVEFEYKPNTHKEFIRLEITNNLVTGGTFSIDDVLIRPKDSDVFFVAANSFFKNNRYIRK